MKIQKKRSPQTHYLKSRVHEVLKATIPEVQCLQLKAAA